MTGALIILLATIVVGVILYLWHHFEQKRNGEADVLIVVERPEGCCGQHVVCEKDSLLTGVNQDVLYYEDEELDSYKGVNADEYTDEQIEQFRDVLYTLKEDEVAGWARSIQQREIILPTIIKEELLMIVSEKRKTEKPKGN